MIPFTAVFQYRRFFASSESGGIGGVDCNFIVGLTVLFLGYQV